MENRKETATRCVEKEEERLYGAKLVFDRIWSTAIITLNSVWCLIMGAYALMVMFTDDYNVEKSVLAVAISTGVVAAVNAVNWITRRFLRKY